MWGFHVSDARKVFPCQVFSDTLCFGLFSFTIVSSREVPQMYWKLFNSHLSVFNSAALDFLCAYIKCSWLQSTQRSKIPTFKTVNLSSFWKRDIRSLLCGVDWFTWKELLLLIFLVFAMLYMDPCKEWELETGLVWLIQVHHGTGILKYYIWKNGRNKCAGCNDTQKIH